MTTGAISIGLLAPTAAFAGSECAGGVPVTTTYTSNQLATFVVPAGVTKVVVTAAGGAGGSEAHTVGQTFPGDGAVVTSTLSVSPDDALSIAVGQQGGIGVGGESGGSPSGGSPGDGGGGGGASFVTNGDILQIAAGGGGGAGIGFDSSNGGNAAAVAGKLPANTIAVGGNGGNGSSAVSPRGSGGGGGSESPGAAGASGAGFPAVPPGSGRVGGATAPTPPDSSGAGGGGFAGGGSGGLGGSAGGGGAGSSYGIDAYTLSPNSGDGSVTISYDAPSVTSENSATFPAQQFGSFTVCATGTPTATITETGALPDGVSFVDNGDGTASLSGTPATGAEGAYPLSFTAANGNGSNAGQSFTLTVSKDTPNVLLSASPTSSVFGDQATFTAEIDGVPDGSAPTGTVAFQNNGSSISSSCDAAPITTTAGVSTATCITSDLATSSEHSVTAAYSGDADYTAGNVAEDDYDVSQATPTVSLNASPTSSSFGFPVTFTAEVDGPLDASAPTGTVAFQDGGSSISAACDAAPVTTTAGVSTATCTTSDFSSGDHPITATYSGDANYTAGDPASDDYSVGQAIPDVVLTSSSNPSVFGQSVNATATITPSSLGGSVQFTVDGVDLGDPVTVISGTAQSAPLTDSGSPLPTGDNSVTATFTPTDTTDYLTTITGLDQAVGAATPALSLSASPTTSTFGDPVTFTAQVSGIADGAAPTGSVAFQANGSSISTACDAASVSTTDGVSIATCTTSALGAGTDSVTATYSGDNNYTGGANDTHNYFVDQATPGVALTTSSNPSAYGQSITATATVSPSNVAGTVQFKVNGVDLGSPVTPTSGSAQSATLTDAGDPLPVGGVVVSAIFVPSDTTDYLTGGSTIEQVVDKATPDVSLTTPTMSSNFGDSVTFTAQVDGAPTGSAPTGTVAFRDNGVSISPTCDSATVTTAAGVTTATCTTSALTTGANIVTVSYSGDTNYTGGIGTDEFPVFKATPSVDLTTSANPSVFGQSITATAAVTPSNLAGTVQFKVSGTDVGSPVTVVAGSATSPTLNDAGNLLPAGGLVVSATFVPTDTTDYVNGAVGIDQIVDHATPVVNLTPDVNPSVSGQSTTAVAAVTPADLGGSVQFSVNGTDVGSPVTVSSGTAASPPLTDAGDPLSPGDNIVAAIFTPTDMADYTTGSTSFDQVVDKAATALSVDVTPTTLSAVVSAVAPGAGSPTGTVTFSVDGTPVGTAPLTAGTASLSDTVPTGSSHSVSAVYSGDAEFTGSSGSTSRVDPTITTTVTSARPRTHFGWYNSPVTVSFVCATSGSPLISVCPAPVTMTASAGGQSVTRTITATDGGTATAVVNSINIDRVKPHVTVHGVSNHAIYDGAAPAVRCVGTDALSGIATCSAKTVTSTPSARDVRTTRYSVMATDKAGNTAIVRGSYKVLGLFVKAAPFTSDAFDVKVGHHYVVGFDSTTRPRYYEATPSNGSQPTPFKKGAMMTNAGHGVWTLRISITALMRHDSLWNIGVKSHGRLHVIRLRLIG